MQHEVSIDRMRPPHICEEFGPNEFGRGSETWTGEMPDGNGHGIDVVRYAVMGDVVQGA